MISERYGSSVVAKWKFELWNEPDLQTYNVLDFTFDGEPNSPQDITDCSMETSPQGTWNTQKTFRWH